MITIKDLQRVARIVNISGLAELAFGKSDRIARNLRDKVRFGRELDATEALRISEVCKEIGMPIEHWKDDNPENSRTLPLDKH